MWFIIGVFHTWVGFNPHYFFIKMLIILFIIIHKYFCIIIILCLSMIFFYICNYDLFKNICFWKIKITLLCVATNLKKRWRASVGSISLFTLQLLIVRYILFNFLLLLFKIYFCILLHFQWNPTKQYYLQMMFYCTNTKSHLVILRWYHTLQGKFTLLV